MDRIPTERKKIIMLDSIPTLPQATITTVKPHPPNAMKPAEIQQVPIEDKNQKHSRHIVMSDSESDDEVKSTLSLPWDIETRLMRHQIEGVQWLYGTFLRKTGHSFFKHVQY